MNGDMEMKNSLKSSASWLDGYFCGDIEDGEVIKWLSGNKATRSRMFVKYLNSNFYGMDSTSNRAIGLTKVITHLSLDYALQAANICTLPYNKDVYGDTLIWRDDGDMKLGILWSLRQAKECFFEMMTTENFKMSKKDKERVRNSGFFDAIATYSFVSGDVEFLDRALRLLDCSVDDIKLGYYAIKEYPPRSGRLLRINLMTDNQLRLKDLLILNYQEGVKNYLVSSGVSLPSEEMVKRVIWHAGVARYANVFDMSFIESKADLYRSALAKNNLIEKLDCGMKQAVYSGNTIKV